VIEYLKQNDKLVKDANGDKIKLESFENEPSEEMRKLSAKNNSGISDRDFLKRIGLTETELDELDIK